MGGSVGDGKEFGGGDIPLGGRGEGGVGPTPFGVVRVAGGEMACFVVVFVDVIIIGQCCYRSTVRTELS